MQESREGQCQYARALYYQALVYGAEGKERLKKRSTAAARQALEDVCEEYRLLAPPLDRELEKIDFEKVLEFRLI